MPIVCFTSRIANSMFHQPHRLPARGTIGAYSATARRLSPASCPAVSTHILPRHPLFPTPLHQTPSLTSAAIILGGGAGTRLFPLTKSRAKPAVPIGGAYRLIDVPMSNCINSGISKIYILTQVRNRACKRCAPQGADTQSELIPSCHAHPGLPCAQLPAALS
jgi:hypothetical protein